MDEKRLVWAEEDRKQIIDCRVFSVWESHCKPPAAQQSAKDSHVFTIIDDLDWVITIPVINHNDKKEFVMVWQWRHGLQSLSLEFPGGVLEKGEDPKKAALRELYEETGYKPGKIEKIGEFSPNPAIMSNKVHFFLAEDLSGGGKQNLDEDEYVEVALAGINEVMQGMGKEPYVHALMGAALALYNQKNSLL
jgi:8-oxo-dGTP pyrophosphatase MutT (NUDIX family)